MKNRKFFFITMAGIILVILIIFIMFPPGKGPKPSESIDLDQDVLAAKTIKEKHRVQVPEESRLAFYDGDFFLLGDKVSEINFSKQELRDADNYRSVLKKYDKLVFYLENRSIYLEDDPPRMVYDKPDEYSFQKGGILIRDGSNFFLYNVVDKRLIPLLEHVDTSFIKSMEHIFLLNGGRNYIIYNPDNNISYCYEVYSDRLMMEKSGMVVDVSFDGSTFLLIKSPEDYSALTEYDLLKGEGNRYNLTEAGETGAYPPQYAEDGRIYYLTRKGTEYYFKTLKTEDLRIRKFALDPKTSFKDVLRFGDKFVLQCSDRFYYGTLDEMREYGGTFDDMILTDETLFLIYQNQLRMIHKSKDYTYALGGKPIQYAVGNKNFCYIYQDPVSKLFYVTRERLDL